MCKDLLFLPLLFVSGEANANYNRDVYNCSFPAMIDDWRMAFHEGSDGQTALDFPFGFVQVLLNREAAHCRANGRSLTSSSPSLDVMGGARKSNNTLNVLNSSHYIKRLGSGCHLALQRAPLP